MDMIVHPHVNKTHFHKKGCALGLILNVRVFGTRKWPIKHKVVAYFTVTKLAKRSVLDGRVVNDRFERV